MQLLNARDALPFFSAQQLLELVETGKLHFYLKNRDGTFSDKLCFLYESRRKSFLTSIDEYFFEYNEFNSIVSNNTNYLTIKTIHIHEYNESDIFINTVFDDFNVCTIETNSELLTSSQLINRWDFFLSEFDMYELIVRGDLLLFERRSTIYKNNQRVHILAPRDAVYDNEAQHIITHPDFEPTFILANVLECERKNSIYGGSNERDTASLKARISELEAEIMEFKAQTAAPQEVVTVNAALWEESCKAACVVTEQIAKNRERGITKDAFLGRMKAVTPNKVTCSGADRAAWKALPDEYKNGPGCPKK